jgi:ribosomal protein S12 methylthiotransferase accessory factor
MVERDAFGLWDERDADDRASRQVDPDTVTDPGCRRLLELYERAEVAVSVWDRTTDIGLPVFSVSIADSHADPVRRLPAALGGGCHPDRAVALSRALTEAAQSRLTYISAGRDDFAPDYYRHVRDAETIKAQVSRLGGHPQRAFEQVAHLPEDSIDGDVTRELDCLKAAGLEQAILVDLTRSDVGIRVVRMVIPGLEGWVEKVEANVPGERLRAMRDGL